MSFIVVHVLPNGNLVVEGCRQRMITREMRTLRLRGIVRPADIGPFNTLQSQYIANLTFTYEGKAQSPTTRTRVGAGELFNKLWPFSRRAARQPSPDVGQRREGFSSWNSPSPGVRGKRGVPRGIQYPAFYADRLAGILIDENDHEATNHNDHCLGLALSSAHSPGLRPTCASRTSPIWKGAQSNHLVGFGLVVGLNGTGSKQTFTQQVAVDMLQRFMVTTKITADVKGDSAFKSGNISAVMVTTELGPVRPRRQPGRRHRVRAR